MLIDILNSSMQNTSIKEVEQEEKMDVDEQPAFDVEANQSSDDDYVEKEIVVPSRSKTGKRSSSVNSTKSNRWTPGYKAKTKTFCERRASAGSVKTKKNSIVPMMEENVAKKKEEYKVIKCKLVTGIRGLSEKESLETLDKLNKAKMQRIKVNNKIKKDRKVEYENEMKNIKNQLNFINNDVKISTVE